MELLETGAKLLAEKLGVDLDVQTITTALQGLLSDGSGNLDLAGLVSRMSANGELGGIVKSWLGDGANADISADSIQSLFGQSKVSDFASNLGTDSRSAAQALSDVLPQMLDKASNGGNLLDAAGGIEGLMGAAKSFFK